MDVRMLWLLPLSMICQFIDSSMGMGYGVLMTSLLLAIGFEPSAVVPAVLLSDFVSGITAGFFHHSERNVDFSPRSIDTKVVVLLSSFAVVGAVVSALFLQGLPSRLVSVWISVMVIYMAFVILTTRNQPRSFRWWRLIVFTGIASVNKGISGGGYGPLVMGGQMLSGVDTKKAVGITSMSEGIVCFAALAVYVLFTRSVDWMFAPWLLAGSVLAIPFAVKLVKTMKEEKLRHWVAVVLLVLSIFTFGKALIETFPIRFVFSSLLNGQGGGVIVF